MVDPSSILELSDRIVREFQPERISFRSYAYGTSTSNSDIDLLVTLLNLDVSVEHH